MKFVRTTGEQLPTKAQVREVQVHLAAEARIASSMGRRVIFQSKYRDGGRVFSFPRRTVA